MEGEGRQLLKLLNHLRLGLRYVFLPIFLLEREVLLASPSVKCLSLFLSLLAKVVICHLVLCTECEQRILFIGFESGGPFNQVNGDIHLGVHFLLTLLFHLLHLLGVLALVLVQPCVVGKVEPV